MDPELFFSKIKFNFNKVYTLKILLIGMSVAVSVLEQFFKLFTLKALFFIFKNQITNLKINTCYFKLKKNYLEILKYSK
jgi:hypothetical protein